eukprot:250930_1
MHKQDTTENYDDDMKGDAINDVNTWIFSCPSSQQPNLLDTDPRKHIRIPKNIQSNHIADFEAGINIQSEEYVLQQKQEMETEYTQQLEKQRIQVGRVNADYKLSISTQNTQFIYAEYNQPALYIHFRDIKPKTTVHKNGIFNQFFHTFMASCGKNDAWIDNISSKIRDRGDPGNKGNKKRYRMKQLFIRIVLEPNDDANDIIEHISKSMQHFNDIDPNNCTEYKKKIGPLSSCFLKSRAFTCNTEYQILQVPYVLANDQDINMQAIKDKLRCQGPLFEHQPTMKRSIYNKQPQNKIIITVPSATWNLSSFNQHYECQVGHNGHLYLIMDAQRQYMIATKRRGAEGEPIMRIWKRYLGGERLGKWFLLTKEEMKVIYTNTFLNEQSNDKFMESNDQMDQGKKDPRIEWLKQNEQYDRSSTLNQFNRSNMESDSYYNHRLDWVSVLQDARIEWTDISIPTLKDDEHAYTWISLSLWKHKSVLIYDNNDLNVCIVNFMINDIEPWTNLIFPDTHIEVRPPNNSFLHMCKLLGERIVNNFLSLLKTDKQFIVSPNIKLIDTIGCIKISRMPGHVCDVLGISNLRDNEFANL